MAQDEIRSDKQGEPDGDTLLEESTQLKKRARRRLIGAVALALLAAIVLPMVMDHQPAPPLKDIQVRIPSPDEGVTQPQLQLQRVAPKSVATADPAPAQANESPSVASPTASPPVKDMAAQPVIKPAEKSEPKFEQKPEAKPATELWEIQLGAYQEPGRVKILLAKLKQMGVPTYTEKVDTAAGSRTRVRAGPFPSQEAAEKARVRVKIVGVDGPVARKP